MGFALARSACFALLILVCCLSACRTTQLDLASDEPRVMSEEDMIQMPADDPLWDLAGESGWNQPRIEPERQGLAEYVEVSAVAYRHSADADWIPLSLKANEYGYDVYTVLWQLMPEEAETVEVLMRADPHGGVSHIDGSYDHYFWAFRDGMLACGDEAAARELVHVFQKEKEEEVLIVRVQVQDAAGDLIYGDSGSIHFRSYAAN